MKNKSQVKKKNKSKQKYFFLFLSLSLIIVFLFILIGVKYSNNLRQGNVEQYSSQNNKQAKMNPSSSIKVLDATKYQVDTSTWKTYYDSTFDISIKYPPDWKVFTNDERQFGPDEFGNAFRCEHVTYLLKDPNSCSPNVVNHTFGIEKSNESKTIGTGFSMYIQAHGAGTPELDTLLSLQVNGNKYTLPVNYAQKSLEIPVSYYRSAGDGPYAFPGPKSIWKSVYLNFFVFDPDFPTFINILESIKN